MTNIERSARGKTLMAKGAINWLVKTNKITGK
jgi:hypothetical protein